MGATAAWLLFPTKEIRYRFEVTVDTPDGAMTGYSVHRMVIHDNTNTPARNYRTDFDAEAVSFELSDGRYLLATLRPADGIGMVQLILTAMGSSGYSFPRLIDMPTEFDAAVPAKHFPKLAIVDGPTGPETLRWVPDEGEFTVVQARVVSTNQDVSETISKALPWLVKFIEDAPYAASKMDERHKIAFALKAGVRG